MSGDSSSRSYRCDPALTCPPGPDRAISRTLPSAHRNLRFCRSSAEAVIKMVFRIGQHIAANIPPVHTTLSFSAHLPLELDQLFDEHRPGRTLGRFSLRFGECGFGSLMISTVQYDVLKIDTGFPVIHFSAPDDPEGQPRRPGSYIPQPGTWRLHRCTDSQVWPPLWHRCFCRRRQSPMATW